MTLGFVDQTIRQKTASVLSDVFTLPFTPGTDEGLVLLFHVDGNNHGVASLSGCGANWTLADRAALSTEVVEVWVADACDGTHNQITLTLTGVTEFAYLLVRVSMGSGNHLEVGAANSGTGSASPADSGNITALAGDLVIGCAHNSSNIQTLSTNPTTPGYTTLSSFLVNSNARCRQAYKFSAGATEDLQWTQFGSHGWAATIAAINEDVTPVLQPPVAEFTYTTANLTATFDASGSSDPDGTIVDYAWDFGDGATSSGATDTGPVHVYVGAGTYTATLTVTDNDGLTATTVHDVIVRAAVPLDNVPTIVTGGGGRGHRRIMVSTDVTL